MSLDEVKRQFVEQVKLRAYDDKYIDKTKSAKSSRSPSRRA